MKFIVGFKTPDAFDQVVEALKIEAATKVEESEDSDSLEDLKDWTVKSFYVAKATFDKFVEYGEAIRIEFDTDAKTATVIKV